jgi:hypothetical protein
MKHKNRIDMSKNVAKSTLLAMATIRSGNIVLMQNVRSTLAEAA